MEPLLIQLQTIFHGRDENLITVVGFLLLTTLAGIYLSKKRNSVNALPSLPGPTGLPIVGYLPFVGPQAHKTFAELKKKYGPVFKVQMGSIPCLVIGNYKAAKEAFIKQKETYSGRPKDFIIKVYDHETAFVFDEGESFKDVRTFSMDALKKLGFGRRSLEPLIKMEVQSLINELKKLNGEPSDVDHLLIKKSVGNSICSILIGKRCEYDDPWLTSLIHTVDDLMETYVHDFAYFFPWIKKIPFINKFMGHGRQVVLKNKIWQLWQEKVDETQKNESDKEFKNSFITAWFTEEKLRKAKNNPTAELYSESNLISNLDIFSQAAFGTTATTLMWFFYTLMGHPEQQKRIQHEIDQHFANNEELSFVDAKYMPYTKAFIQEAHRFSSVASLGAFHCTREASVLMGFHVPKRMLTIPCLYAILHDEQDFPEPMEFKPERFLAENGDFVFSEKVIPFSIGMRFCPGENVAQMQLFNYLTHILKTFDLKFGPGSSYSFDLFSSNALVTLPKSFSICFLPRKLNDDYKFSDLNTTCL